MTCAVDSHNVQLSTSCGTAIYPTRFFYKNNFIRRKRLKFAQKLRTIKLLKNILGPASVTAVSIEKQNTMLHECHENFCLKLCFCRRQNSIWITNMFAVITNIMKTRII